MKHLVYPILTILMLACTFSACQDMEHDLKNPNNTESFSCSDTTYVGQFQRMWQGIDVGYVFWKWDPVDWDKVYDTYLPVFEAADRHHRKTGKEGMTYDDYAKTWSSIITPLLDHHLTAALYRPDDLDKERVIVGPTDNHRKEPDYHRCFTRKEHVACLNSMLNNGQLSGYFRVDSVKSAEQNMEYVIHGMFSVSGKDSVAYLYISSFMILPSYLSQVDSSNKNSLLLWLSCAVERPEVSLIFDTRGNAGGYSSWQTILGQFFTKEAFCPNIAYFKAGFDRLDYTPGMKNMIYPNAAGQVRTMSEAYPFVCLFDRNSFSNGEEIPWMFSYLPGYVSVGERTGGGMGTLYLENYTSFFSGTFGNSHIMDKDYQSTSGNYYCYMSTVANVDARSGQMLEGVGMIPTISCPLDTVAFFSGQSDNQLLRTMQYLRTKK